MDDKTTNTTGSATDGDRAFKREDGWWGVRGLPTEHYFDEHTARRVARQLDDADQADDAGETEDEQDQRIAHELDDDAGGGDGG